MHAKEQRSKIEEFEKYTAHFERDASESHCSGVPFEKKITHAKVTAVAYSFESSKR